MQSVRLRIAAIAALATLVAISAVAFFLLSSVERSLVEEIESSITNQVIDYQEQISLDDVGAGRLPLDAETLFVVLNAEGELLDQNDVSVDGVEVIGALDLAAAATGDVLLADVSFTSPSETPGSEEMRAAYAELIFVADTDQPIYVMFARVTAGVDRTVDRMRNALLIAVPLVVAFVSALAWWLTGRSLRPVDRMRREVDEITSSDLGRRVSEPTSTDEIGQLATTMNRMLARLEQAKESQDQFVSDAAHELRTPLASIAAQLDVDAAHPASADVALTARNVRGEVTRLQTLIDGLLASARNADEPKPLPTALVDLDVVVGDAARRISTPDGITIDQRSIGAGTVRGDEHALTRLIDNLLANAGRHAASAVAVAVGTDTAGVWLTVDDDGAGVDPSDREQIFDRFVRLDEARTRDAGGSGLGLALAQETVHQHGGTIRCIESALGGARFEIRLPEAG